MQNVSLGGDSNDVEPVNEELITPEKRPHTKLLPAFSEDECRLIAATRDEIETCENQQPCLPEWGSVSDSPTDQMNENEMVECQLVGSVFSSPQSDLEEAEEEMINPLQKVRDYEIKWPNEEVDEPLVNGSNLLDVEQGRGEVEEEVEVEELHGGVFTKPTLPIIEVYEERLEDVVCEEPTVPEEQPAVEELSSPGVHAVICEDKSAQGSYDEQAASNVNKEGPVHKFAEEQLSPEECNEQSVPEGYEEQSAIEVYEEPSETTEHPSELHPDVILALEHLAASGNELSLEGLVVENQNLETCHEIHSSKLVAPDTSKSEEVDETLEGSESEQRLMCETTGVLPNITVSEIPLPDKNVPEASIANDNILLTTSPDGKPPPSKPKSKGLFNFFKRKSPNKEKKNRAASESPMLSTKISQPKKSGTLEARHIITTEVDNQPVVDVKNNASKSNSLPSFFRKFGFGRSSGRKKENEEKQELENGKNENSVLAKETKELPESKQSGRSPPKKSNLRIFEILAQNHGDVEKSSDADDDHKKDDNVAVSVSIVPEALETSVDKSVEPQSIPVLTVKPEVEKTPIGISLQATNSIEIKPDPCETSGKRPEIGKFFADVKREEHKIIIQPKTSVDVHVVANKKTDEIKPSPASSHFHEADVPESTHPVPLVDYNATVVGEPQTSLASHYLVVVAIDFGTAFSGYAFSFVKDPLHAVHMMGKWEDGDPGVINQKTPTTLLVTPDGKFHSFGFTARNDYNDLNQDETKEWMFFDRFKMALYETDVDNCNQDTCIESVNGKQFPAIRAISMTLSFFREHALREISAYSGMELHNEDVLWVVTVPAIWNSPAKQLMRLAAYDAGLASRENPDQLLVALEPEAASVHICRLRLHQLIPEKPVIRRLSVIKETQEPVDEHELVADFKRVCRYMVVDCGGGTVDITVHEMNSSTGSLRELRTASGGAHGSSAIDLEFAKLLGEIFGDDFVESFHHCSPSGWISLMITFESRKRAADPLKKSALNVALPFAFLEHHRKTKGSTVEQAIKKFGDPEIRWSPQGMLKLSQQAMRKLFKPTIDKIRQATADVLNSVQGIQYIFLVGGLSESPILQTELRQLCAGQPVKVVIPQAASLVVVKGAVSFGLNPTVITARRSRLTYGASVLNRFIHGAHPESKYVYKDGGEWCKDVFDIFVSTDQPINLGDVVERSYVTAGADQRRMTVGIYCTENKLPVFVTDPEVKKCANINLDLTSTADGSSEVAKRRFIKIRMLFASTEIKITAVDTSTGRHVDATFDLVDV